MTAIQICSLIIFLLTLIAIITEKVHRVTAAMAGAIAVVIFRVLSVEESIAVIDFNTLGVLLGMMIFVGVVKESGIFEYIAIKTAKISQGNPWKIMMSFTIITALLSAFLDNVTTVLLIGPMTIAVTAILGLNPIPFLMTQIMASNIGGTATLIGDPPNIMIGSATGLSFIDFLEHNGSTVVIVMIVTIILFYYIYGKELKVTSDKMHKVMELDEKSAIKDFPLMIKSIVLMVFVVIGFIVHDKIGLESCIIALLAGTIMLLIGRQNIEDMIHNVEWTTILFFMGLFVVVGGLDKTGVIEMLANFILSVTNGNQIATMLMILWISAFVSAFLDNIPFVATMIPLILTMESHGLTSASLWWALSLGACFGGNGTLIGASANVVLADISKKNGYPITYSYYIKRGFPLMLVSVFISMLLLLVEYR
jgi:Na+/H+ antiporter NhaD/arsenite permease-like protein